LVGWFWYLGTLIPVIGLVQVGDQAMADRYTYLPSIGLFVMLCWGIYAIQGHVVAPGMTRIGWAIALLVCAVLTWEQIGYWHDTKALWQHALDVTENNHIAHANLAVHLMEMGQPDEAVIQAQKAVRIRANAPAYLVLGNRFLQRKMIDEARGQYLKALETDPRLADCHNNLGTVARRSVRKGRATFFDRATTFGRICGGL
jgi:tetratricopeptide (TPR) repeat protein